MPPKPWLTKTGPPRQDVSAIIQSNPTIKQQIPKLSAQQAMMGPSTVQQALGQTAQNSLGTGFAGMAGTSNMLGANGLGTYGTGIGTGMGTGYGSSYGGSGYGGYGSSYGGGGYGGYSSYGSGGYGGYGGGYGSYGGGGMYGRMGMMGGDPNQKGFVMNTLVTLESLGFLIGSFCQIGKSLDHNIEGLHLFFNSFSNLFKKIYNAIKSCGEWIGKKIKDTILAVLDFIKTYILFMKHEDPKNRIKSLRTVINISVVILVLTLYPQVKKILNKVG